MAERLSYQEILRTVGTLLASTPVETATLHVSRESAEVSVPPGTPPRRWTLAALQTESQRQRDWRLQPRLRWQHPQHIGRHLRGVGRALDAVGDGPYTIITRPGAVQVQGAGGFERTFAPPSLEARVAQAAHLRWPRQH
jgi:hypothetical protein